MNITIRKAVMTHDAEEGYRGNVLFDAEGHKSPYEVTLLSAKGSTWDYSLSFAFEPGPEEQIDAVEAALEQDDELFDALIDAAMEALG